MTRVQQDGETSGPDDRGSGCAGWTEASRAPRLQEGRQDRLSLARIIESRVIPAMLVAHKPNAFLPPIHVSMTPPDMAARVGELADLVIHRDAAFATSYVEDMLAGGAPVEELFKELLGPTARRLGELWNEDINSMMDVTQGMAHLQQLVRTFAPEFTQTGGVATTGRRALLMPLPGERHVLGIAMVEQYFRREGWHVWGGPPGSIQDVVALVSTMWFDMVGFSVNVVSEPEKLAFDLRLIRAAARNRNLAIMVGGHGFTENPELAARVGADATAVDGAQAVLRVADLVPRTAALA